MQLLQLDLKSEELGSICRISKCCLAHLNTLKIEN